MVINSIEIGFHAPVKVTIEDQMKLHDILIDICNRYNQENPSRVMWPGGEGAKPIWREPEEPEFDDTVYYVDVFERENYEFNKDNPSPTGRLPKCCDHPPMQLLPGEKQNVLKAIWKILTRKE